MRIAIVPGSFDPITVGHLDIIKRASKMFDHVIVVVGCNPAKKYMFSNEDRMKFIAEATKDIQNVGISSTNGLIIDFARNANACAIVKGLRAVTDYEYELQMALVNRHLDSDVETVFLVADPKHLHISSSVVKQLAASGVDVSDMVLPSVSLALAQKRV